MKKHRRKSHKNFLAILDNPLFARERNDYILVRNAGWGKKEAKTWLSKKYPKMRDFI